MSSNIKQTIKQFILFPISMVSCMLLFGLMQNTMLNYGYDYYQFLSPIWYLIPFILLIALGWCCLMPESRLSRLCTIIEWNGLLILPLLFWFFRTRVHLFGGDGNIFPMQNTPLSIHDFILPLPWEGRLDEYGMMIFGKILYKVGAFSHIDILPSIFTASLYSIFLGIVFICIAYLAFHTKKGAFAIVATSPFIFNFFGNENSYAFSLCYGIIFLSYAAIVFKKETKVLKNIIILAVLWLIGIWVHPFHIFSGFIVAIIFSLWIVQFKSFRKLPLYVLPAIYGVICFCAIKVSKYGHKWIEWNFTDTPPVFSIDTFTHFLNMILLPIVPILFTAFLQRKSNPRLYRTLYIIFMLESLIFFVMSFTLGVVDQFNYYHLLFFFMMPWILLMSQYPFSIKNALVIVLFNLVLLIPMIGVHSSHATIERALALYPIDPCAHNRVMSWQTHLGLVIGDNLQKDKKISDTALKVLLDGVKHATPEGFRQGNLAYYIAFHYQYGRFVEGRLILEQVLKQYPTFIRWYLSDRPGFIYKNKDQLWNDIDSILAKFHPEYLPTFRQYVTKAKEQARQKPYLLTDRVQ